MEEKYIAAIDLGTSKLALTVAKICGEDVQIIYYKETPSVGIRYSSVLNLKVSKPLQDAIREAEEELNIKILQVVVGMPRYSVQVETATGRIDRDPNTCIQQEEVDSLKSMALDSYPLTSPKSEVLYGAVAQSFSTEDSFQMIESDTVGMVSEYLEGNFKVFIGQRRPVSNIDMLLNSLGVSAVRKYFVPDVTAKAVLTNEEMEGGVALIDFGGGVTSVSIYKNNIMRHYASIPFGGKSITADIMSECSISENLAENIKLAFGALMPDKLQTLSEKVIQINDENDVPWNQIPVKYLSEIMTCRTREIIRAILFEIQESGFADGLRCGVVVTGGAANMTGCAGFIKEESGYNVRIGYPRKKFSALGCNGVGETSAASSIGMILEAKNDNLLSCIIAPPKPEPVVEEEEPVVVEENTTETEVAEVVVETYAPSEQTQPVEPADEFVTPSYEEPVAAAPSYDTTPSNTGFMAAPSYDEYAPVEEDPEPTEQQVQENSIFREDQLPEIDRTPKKKEPKKSNNIFIKWIKKTAAQVEEKVGTLYDMSENNN